MFSTYWKAYSFIKHLNTYYICWAPLAAVNATVNCPSILETYSLESDQCDHLENNVSPMQSSTF